MQTEPEAPRAKPVFAEPMPIAIPRLSRISKAITTLYGPDCYMRQYDAFMVFWTPGEDCPCQKCRDYMHAVIGDDSLVFQGMIVCPTCGNKRCPHASDHDFECTNSNATGQIGSNYP